MRHIRAEDLSIDEDRMYLGGRSLDGGSILFLHVERRVSLELIGYLAVIFGCLFFVLKGQFAGGSAGLLVLAGVLALGALREVRRPYVIVMELFQIGHFEVRGFTADEVKFTEQMLDELRRHGNRRAGQKVSLYS